MLVSEVMTRGVECVSPEDSLQQAAIKLKALDVGPLPVRDRERLVGMLTDRDITIRAVAAGSDPKTAKVREAMTPTVVYCYEDQDIDEAAKLMQTEQIRRIVVLNRGEQLVGILSLGDLAVETDGEQPAGVTLERVSEPAAPRR